MPDARLSQMKLVDAILEWLARQGVQAALLRELNAVIRAATEIVDAFAEPERKVVPGMGLDAWMHSDQTGTSSVFLAGRLSGRFDRQDSHPHDPDDFGRCLGLLEACPELRPNLSRMAKASPEWKALAGAWEELEGLYREESPSGKAPRLLARMQVLLQEAVA